MDHNHGHMDDMVTANEKSCPMIMVFHGGNCERILFKGWVASTLTEFVLSCLAIFTFSVLYEALKFLRDYLLNRSLKRNERKPATHFKPQNANCQDPPSENASCDRRPLARLIERSYRERVVGMAHIVQSLLNLLQVIIAYLLMLIVMTFNYWLCLAVVLGLGVGFFFFGCVRSNSLESECCN